MTTAAARPRPGGQILIDQLVIQGVKHIFCVPGESFLAALDAMYDAPLSVTICRQEGGAAMMAEAHGKLTGQPGICFVTRGPGATNASPGVHVASQDSTPMILFVGQVGRDMRGREAFQELDYAAVFGSMVKWAAEIDSVERIPEYVSRAFHVAMSGRPGPVVLALPEDVLSGVAACQDAVAVKISESTPRPADIEQMERMLAEAKRPVSSRSNASLRPTARATATPGVEQNRPRLIPETAKRAVSTAKARSQLATSWQPAATAAPCTRAMTGLGDWTMACISTPHWANRAW